PAFALGESERLVGQVLTEVCSAGYTRESYVIATKVGVALGQLASELAQNELWASEAVPLSPGGALKDGAFCLQEDFLLTQLRRSRERLGIEHLDVVLIQSPESLLLGGLPWDEARLRLGRALA